MKKYITIAALLAAGSAFANAVTLDDAVKSGTGTTGANTTCMLDAATGSITAVATLDVGLLKAAMAKNAELSKITLINFDAGSDIGLQTNYSSYDHDDNGNTANTINNSGLWGCWNSGGAYSVGMNSGFESDSFWAGAAAAAVTLTYEYSKGTTASFSLVDAQGNVLQELGGNEAGNTTLRGQGLTFSSVVFNDFVTEYYVFDQVVTGAEAKSLSTAAAVAALPEPSTFGLLAGLGALALVGTRRRRK